MRANQRLLLYFALAVKEGYASAQIGDYYRPPGILPGTTHTYLTMANPYRLSRVLLKKCGLRVKAVRERHDSSYQRIELRCIRFRSPRPLDRIRNLLMKQLALVELAKAQKYLPLEEFKAALSADFLLSAERDN